MSACIFVQSTAMIRRSVGIVYLEILREGFRKILNIETVVIVPPFTAAFDVVGDFLNGKI